MKDYNVYYEHILDSALQIQRYTSELTFDTFIQDRKTIDAVIRNFEIIGEASTNIPHEIRKEHTSIPWKSLIGLRNVLIHQYLGVDISILWEHIQSELPDLIQNMQNICNRR